MCWFISQIQIQRKAPNEGFSESDQRKWSDDKTWYLCKKWGSQKKKKKGRGKERMNAEVSTINSTLGMGNGIK